VEITFGRAEECDVVVGREDRGVSRRAGVVRWIGGLWWVMNLSENRALHLVDDTGYATPIPVSGSESTPSGRPVIAPGGSVLVAGELRRYYIRLSTSDAPSPAARSEVPAGEGTFAGKEIALTANRKEALVAMLYNYLQPVPRYDPRPLSYAEAAEVAALPASTVRKRIEDLRGNLADTGVPGLTGDDSPRRLAEWALVTRMVVPADLEWLRERVERRRVGSP